MDGAPPASIGEAQPSENTVYEAPVISKAAEAAAEETESQTKPNSGPTEASSAAADAESSDVLNQGVEGAKSETETGRDQINGEERRPRDSVGDASDLLASVAASAEPLEAPEHSKEENGTGAHPNSSSLSDTRNNEASAAAALGDLGSGGSGGEQMDGLQTADQLLESIAELPLGDQQQLLSHVAQCALDASEQEEYTLEERRLATLQHEHANRALLRLQQASLRGEPVVKGGGAAVVKGGTAVVGAGTKRALPVAATSSKKPELDLEGARPMRQSAARSYVSTTSMAEALEDSKGGEDEYVGGDFEVDDAWNGRGARSGRSGKSKGKVSGSGGGGVSTGARSSRRRTASRRTETEVTRSNSGARRGVTSSSARSGGGGVGGGGGGGGRRSSRRRMEEEDEEEAWAPAGGDRGGSRREPVQEMESGGGGGGGGGSSSSRRRRQPSRAAARKETVVMDEEDGEDVGFLRVGEYVSVRSRPQAASNVESGRLVEEPLPLQGTVPIGAKSVNPAPPPVQPPTVKGPTLHFSMPVGVPRFATASPTHSHLPQRAPESFPASWDPDGGSRYAGVKRGPNGSDGRATWWAVIERLGTSRLLGPFRTETSAAHAVDVALLLTRGRHVSTNLEYDTDSFFSDDSALRSQTAARDVHLRYYANSYGLDATLTPAAARAQQEARQKAEDDAFCGIPPTSTATASALQNNPSLSQEHATSSSSPVEPKSKRRRTTRSSAQSHTPDSNNDDDAYEPTGDAANSTPSHRRTSRRTRAASRDSTHQKEEDEDEDEEHELVSPTKQQLPSEQAPTQPQTTPSEQAASQPQKIPSEQAAPQPQKIPSEQAPTQPQNTPSEQAPTQPQKTPSEQAPTQSEPPRNEETAPEEPSTEKQESATQNTSPKQDTAPEETQQETSSAPIQPQDEEHAAILQREQDMSEGSIHRL